jgi:hypothetical protein
MRFAWVTLTALLMTVLAGCSSDGGEAADDADFKDLDLKATSTKGLIRGVVVDDAVRPLAGAKVSLQTAGEPLETTTSDEGLFGFGDLDPGTYFIFASKAGFKAVQSSTDVVAGVDEPPILRILLAADESFVAPFAEQYVFDGFIECSTGAGAEGVGYAYGSICSSSPELFPNDRFAVNYALSAAPTFVQSEMIWQSTQAANEWLSHSFHYDDSSHTDGINDRSVEGPNPLVNTMDAETALEYTTGEGAESDYDLRIRVFTVATDGTGPALTFQQRFTVYTTIFYGYEPPAGWTLNASGEVPEPPQ